MDYLQKSSISNLFEGAVFRRCHFTNNSDLTGLRHKWAGQVTNKELQIMTNSYISLAWKRSHLFNLRDLFESSSVPLQVNFI